MTRIIGIKVEKEQFGVRQVFGDNCCKKTTVEKLTNLSK